jgi:2-phospho-L-lactate guanylyltransferase
MRPLVAVPLKAFTTAKGRLAGALAPGERARLMQESALRVIRAAAGAGAAVAVVTPEPAVAEWADRHGADVIAEPPGGGLDGAAAAAAGSAAAAGVVWCIAHGDLPLLTAGEVEAILSAAGTATVLAPSRTGGTNLAAGRQPMVFSYGPGSFRRHLPAAPQPVRVHLTAATAIDLDTPDDLAAAAALDGGGWLRRYLG